MRGLCRPILLALLSLAILSPSAHAWLRTPATTFATLPPGAANPEGITADTEGNIYASLFAVGGTSTGNGQVFVFAPSGRFLRRLDLQGSSTLLLGLAFHPITGALLVLDFGNRTVLKVDPVTGVPQVFVTIPAPAPFQPNSAGINALTFDSAGNVYISDSFLGIIWRTDMNGGNLIQWANDASLRTTGVPGFGANGIAFNNAQTALFVANTGNDTVVRIPVKSDGTADSPAVFVNSINGADGLIIDAQDNLWVCANQADEIVVVNPSGRVIAKLGDFGGIDPQGAPIGLLFPASLVFSGQFLYVTNLSLNLGNTVDSPWAAQVTTHTLGKIPARIPPVRGLP